MLRRLLNIFGIKIFKVGDMVRPNYSIFRCDYVFPNGSVLNRITKIDGWKIYLESYEGFWTKKELEF